MMGDADGLQFLIAIAGILAAIPLLMGKRGPEAVTYVSTVVVAAGGLLLALLMAGGMPVLGDMVRATMDQPPPGCAHSRTSC